MLHGPSRPDAAPILILHLDPFTRRMLKSIYEIEGYIVHETDKRETALGLLQAAEGGMIVYLEVACLRMRDNEQLHDYLMNREEYAPHVFVLFTGSMFTKQDMKRLRADRYLEQPFTADQALASVKEAQRLWLAKHTSPSTQ